MPREPKPCRCGSGKDDEALYDARGIFVGYICEDCEASVRRKYRSEIFTDPNYEMEYGEEDDGDGFYG